MSAEEALRNLADDPELAVEIRDGTEHWRGGEIALTVHGSGVVRVVHRRGGEVRTYAETIEPERVAELAGALADLGFTGFRATRTVLTPDELVTRLALRRADEILYEAEVPGGERHDDDDLDAVMRRYERLVAEVTKGALPFGAAAAPR
jgi:hypothetical protein